MALFVTLGLGVAVFAATNVDDLLILLGFFAEGRAPRWSIVAGQYLGVGLLYGISVVAALIALVIPPALIGLLGFVPVAIGLLKLLGRSRAADRQGERPPGPAEAASPGGQMTAVLMVTLANGCDNIATYTPLFAVHSAREIAALGVVFAAMTGVWCAAAHWLVGTRPAGVPIARGASRALPYVLIGLGGLILWKSQAVGLVWPG